MVQNPEVSRSSPAMKWAFETNHLSKTDSIQPPGNDFQHMVWSGFATIPVYDLGFESGCSKTYDANGVVRLENLCNRLTTLDGVQPVLESSNCPYFRFAMATTR